MGILPVGYIDKARIGNRRDSFVTPQSQRAGLA
jgi:hypothetical protein